MTDHDQLFKKLFEEFFAQLLELVDLDLADKLVAEEATFLKQDLFSAVVDGDRAIVDLAAEVPVKDGLPPVVLIHVEIEGRFRGPMAERLWYYYMYLRLNLKQPVIPILVNLSGGPAGVTEVEWIDEVLGRKVARFRYFNFGLSGSLAEEYLERPQPLAWGLAALMRSRKWDRVELKIRCLRAIATADLSEKQEVQLLDLVQTYLELEGPEAKRFDTLKNQEMKEVDDMALTWAGKIEARGRLEGIRGLILRQLEHRFGPLPQEVRGCVEGLDDQSELDRLSDQLLDASSLAELGLST